MIDASGMAALWRKDTRVLGRNYVKDHPVPAPHSDLPPVIALPVPDLIGKSVLEDPALSVPAISCVEQKYRAL